jgi:hypothetical protein
MTGAGVPGGLRLNFNPRLPVVSASCEISPFSILSGRIGGAIGVFEKEVEQTPDFRSWEAAGLIHLAGGNGYRFSLVGGYKQDFWQYKEKSVLPATSNVKYHSEFQSAVPFCGLQTAMYHPWWKARCEILGSWFMDTKIKSNNRNNYPGNYLGYLNEGGIVEFRVEGTGRLMNNLRFGVFGKYSFQELLGPIAGPGDNGRTNFDMRLNENMGSVGVNLNLVF